MEPDVPCVPHMFAQRIDALPEELLLTTLSPSHAEERPGFLQSFGWGRGTNAGTQQQLVSKAELRKLLQRRRREELAADADTADYSSEPYDSIPRQVQLQWRLYARLYPEEVAESEKLASMLQGQEDVEKGAPLGGTGDGWRRDGVNGNGGGGTRTLFGLLPSVTTLQQTVRGLVSPAHTSTSTDPGKPAGPTAAVGPAARASAAGASGAAAPRDAAAAVGGSSFRLGSAGTGAASTPLSCSAGELWRQPDPICHKLSRSLDQWYDLHRQQTRPLRRGHRARLLVVRGVDLPAEWKGSMRPAAAAAGDAAGARRGGWLSSGGTLLLRAAAAVCAMGLRRRPQVWEVGGTAADHASSRMLRSQEPQADGQQEQRGGGRGPSLQASRPRRGSIAADGGRGLVAAQTGARGMNFVLRKTTLIPPDWL